MQARPSLLLCEAQAPYNECASALRAGPAARWLPLLKDYTELQRWAHTLDAVASRLPPGPLVRDAARELRGPFLDLITQLGKRHDSPEWWASRVAERNPMVSPLFLHCCWVSIVERLMTESATPLCVVCDAPEVLEVVAATAASLGAPTATVRARRHLRLPPGVSAVTGFVARAAYHRVRAPRRMGPEARPRVLIRTWMDEGSFGDDGRFRDRFFPGLADWLERSGAAATTMPVAYNVRRSYAQAWRWLRDAPGSYLAAESYLKVRDHVWALRAAARSARLPSGKVRLDGRDITRLVRADRRRWAFDWGTLQALLSTRLGARLQEHGFEPQVVVTTFENQIVDKALALGMRRALPRTRVVGYQHSSVPPLLLSHYVTSGESAFAPYPDRVVCCGRFPRELLVREGLPRERTAVGPALRYAYLWQGAPTRQARGHAVLVTLPLVTDAALELLVKVTAAFGGNADAKVIVKPHPMLRERELDQLVSSSGMPAGFELAGGSMEDCLRRAGVVVGLGSAALYESLAHGVPVVVVGRDSGLDLNPLEWHTELGRVFFEPAAIAAEAARLNQLPEAELAAYGEQVRRLLEDSFEPVTETAMRAFTDGYLPEAADGA